MGAPLPKLKLTKAYYCSNRYDTDLNSDGTFKIQQGWIVTGFLDSNKVGNLLYLKRMRDCL